MGPDDRGIERRRSRRAGQLSPRRALPRGWVWVELLSKRQRCAVTRGCGLSLLFAFAGELVSVAQYDLPLAVFTAVGLGAAQGPGLRLVTGVTGHVLQIDGVRGPAGSPAHQPQPLPPHRPAVLPAGRERARVEAQVFVPVRVPVSEVVAAWPYMQGNVQGASEFLVGRMERVVIAAVQPQLRVAV